MSSSLTENECFLCEYSLETEEENVTTTCGHTFHRRCAQKRLDEKGRSDCKICRQPSALSNALQKWKITTIEPQFAPHHSKQVEMNECEYGGECRMIDDENHAEEYSHPSYCPLKSRCCDVTKEHLLKFRHIELCRYGLKCIDYQKDIENHCQMFRHCALNCPYGNHCALFHDKQHQDKFEHPFPSPCLFTPFHCKFYTQLTDLADPSRLQHDIQQHCLHSAHVCRFGRNCPDKTDLHWKKTIHVARHICPNGDKCPKLDNEDHLNSFTHPNVPDIRQLCQYADQCYDRRKLDHIIKFRHTAKLEQSAILCYSNLNSGTNFVQNQKDIIERVTRYVESENWKPLVSGIIPQDILNWLRTVQPVHRCNPIVFESILLHGHVMSREYMMNLKDPKFVANSVLQHSRIRRIQHLQEKIIAERAKEFIVTLVKDHFHKKGFFNSTGDVEHTGSSLSSHSHGDSTSYAKTIKKHEAYLSSVIESKDLEAIRTKSMQIADASINLHMNPSGIGFDTDKDLGTDKSVFSVIGPHLGHYYGDVFITFKREVLHHPDANFIIQAATSFVSGNAFQFRPWLGVAPQTREERVKLYHRSKLNASIPGYDYATAIELIALTSHFFKLKSMNVDLEKILERWFNVDSHLTIEGHLPQLIPLSDIDHIYIPKNLFDLLSSDSHQSINANFKNRLTQVKHDGEVNQPQGIGRPTPTSKSRANYQNFVIDKLRERFVDRMKYSSSTPIRGTAITIASTDFTDPYILPLTISQAYEQYSFAKKHSPPNNAFYVYWQVVVGDMMVTLSNEPIVSDEKQPNLRCLTAYVSGKGPPSDTSYHEHYSYINDSPPFKHPILREAAKFAAKSNRFYVGCNTDDLMTFCLEIQRSTGTVTLSHAGPNSIYNQEKISFSFDKSRLDLTKLNYVHCSSGSRTVPITNLIISFEKQLDLHPTFDKHFNKFSSIEHKRVGDPSKLIPCRDNVNCLLQHSSLYGSTHNATYSHPCPFSEICRKKESYFTHFPHQVSICNSDENCSELNNPFHRAEYRHTNLPDFLIPCRYQVACYDKSDQHRRQFSHGEQVYQIKELTKKKFGSKQEHSNDQQTPCQWGSKCWNIKDEKHAKEYFHPIDHRSGHVASKYLN